MWEKIIELWPTYHQFFYTITSQWQYTLTYFSISFVLEVLAVVDFHLTDKNRRWMSSGISGTSSMLGDIAFIFIIKATATVTEALIWGMIYAMGVATGAFVGITIKMYWRLRDIQKDAHRIRN